MKKLGFLLFIFALFSLVLTGCNQPNETPTEDNQTHVEEDTSEQFKIYNLAVKSGFTGTYEEWLNSIKGDSIVLQVAGGYIQWKYTNDSEWKNLISLNELKGSDGQDGSDGTDGVDGKTPEFRVSEGYLQWKYTTEDDSCWRNVYKLIETPKVETVTVTYYTTDENQKELILYTSQTVTKGTMLEKPSDPILKGYTFEGWYYYDKYEDDYLPWKFEYYVCGTDLELIPYFVESYTISIVDRNGYLYDSLNVNYDDYVELPSFDIEEGYIVKYFLITENEKTEINQCFNYDCQEDITIMYYIVQDINASNLTYEIYGEYGKIAEGSFVNLEQSGLTINSTRMSDLKNATYFRVYSDGNPIDFEKVDIIGGDKYLSLDPGDGTKILISKGVSEFVFYFDFTEYTWNVQIEIEYEPEKPTTPVTTSHYRVDNRELNYVIYEADGSEVSRYASMYAAIVACVNNCGTDAYVSKVESNDKLFVNAEYFDVSNPDMFWHYTQVNVKSDYAPWKSTYWSDVKDTDEIVIFKEPGSGQVQPYANGWKLVSVSDVLEDANHTAVWNACWYLEANATVNLEAYCGITKAVYDVKLSQSRVYPTYKGSDETWAYVGFITMDTFNSSNIGLRCNTTNGKWYYYSGETSYNYENIKIDDDTCIMTSTWNDELKCWIPDADVKLTMELLTIKDNDGDSYIVHRLTMDLSDGRKFVRDYEIAPLTQCATIRFTCGLDIVSKNTFPDYMNGSKFENVVITSAKGTVYQEMIDDSTLYGNTTTLQVAGEYDLLNSNTASDARYHTIIYTPSCVSYDFSTPGKDVYSFSYDNGVFN